MEIDRIKGYHAHIYYDLEDGPEQAKGIYDELDQLFDVGLGRPHGKPVGPHPKPMYMIMFTPAQFLEIVPWLMLNHRSLSVLIHPETGDDLIDHTEFPIWLGEKLPLDEDSLRP